MYWLICFLCYTFSTFTVTHKVMIWQFFTVQHISKENFHTQAGGAGNLPALHSWAVVIESFFSFIIHTVSKAPFLDLQRICNLFHGLTLNLMGTQDTNKTFNHFLNITHSLTLRWKHQRQFAVQSCPRALWHEDTGGARDQTADLPISRWGHSCPTFSFLFFLNTSEDTFSIWT